MSFAFQSTGEFGTWPCAGIYDVRARTVEGKFRRTNILAAFELRKASTIQSMLLMIHLMGALELLSRRDRINGKAGIVGYLTIDRLTHSLFFRSQFTVSFRVVFSLSVLANLAFRIISSRREDLSGSNGVLQE